MSLLGRLAARRYGKPLPRGTVSTTSFEQKPHRVLIAPVNYSGQGRGWAAALESLDPNISARNLAIEVPGGFSFDADLVVPVPTYHNDTDWQRRQFEASAAATHMLIEAEEPPFGRLLGRSVKVQADALAERGVSVAYLAHGTDARLPSRHIENNPLSYYREESIYLPRAEQLAARNIALVTNSGRPAFVSTPDLLLDLPKATWCPVVVDPQRWKVDRTPRERGRPLRVAHAPSVAAYKGTPLIMPTLEKLQAEGIIEFTLLQGIPSARMPMAFGAADVLLDQFRAGSYGVAACEAMAAGCVVVGQISEQVRAAVREASALELPTVEATVGTLESVLRALAADAEFEQKRRRSIEFVHRVHDGRMAAEALRSNWIDPGGETA